MSPALAPARKSRKAAFSSPRSSSSSARIKSSLFFAIRDRFALDFDFAMEFFRVVLSACDQSAVKNTEWASLGTNENRVNSRERWDGHGVPCPYEARSAVASAKVGEAFAFEVGGGERFLKAGRKGQGEVVWLWL